MTIPILKEWKKLLQADLEKVGNKKEDLSQVIKLCEGYSEEIRTDMIWLSENQAFIEQIKRQYKELYFLRFAETPPEKTEQVMAQQLKELSPEEKRREILQIVQAKAPGSKILASEVQEALKQKGFTINAKNPHAVISTIVVSFKDEVEKSEKRGVFIRKTPAQALLSN